MSEAKFIVRDADRTVSLTWHGSFVANLAGDWVRVTTPNLWLPIAGELQGALADGFAEGLVRREGGEPFGLRLALVSQEVNQTQRLTLRSQLTESVSFKRRRTDQ